MKTIITTFVLALISATSYCQELTRSEKELYKIIMKYRKEKGLPSIPLSASLTLVAQTHVKDLVNNNPVVEKCNLHSWSSNGTWTPCCYTPDHKQSECMWSKPAELTSYKAHGYEIAAHTFNSNGDAVITAEDALQLWKKSSGHNAVIVNGDIWKDKWNAIGIGMHKGFAVAWFGKEEDK